MAAKEHKMFKEPNEDAEKILRLIGWQVAAGFLFIVFGLEFAINDIVMHALRPFEHGKAALAAAGLDWLGLNGLVGTVFIFVGAMYLGISSYRFARVLVQIEDKKK